MAEIRVLLVDDDDDDYLIARDLLAEIAGERYDLHWASSYTLGLELLAREEFDVCLLDYHLGEHTGLDLLGEAISGGIRVPFILMTGQGDREVDIQAMEAGAADYLIKGQISAAILERSIRYAIQQHRMIEALRSGEERLSDALRRSESRFRRLSDANMIGIIVANVYGRITEANDAFLGMVGYGRDEIGGEDLQWNAMTVPAYRDADAVALREILANGACRPFEKEYVRKDGSSVPVLFGGALLEGSNDTIVAFVLDLSAQKRIEHELQEANRAKDHFLAVLSHELRTPLTPVLSLVQVLVEDDTLPDILREYIDIIRRNVELEARLIDDLLDLTRVMQGKLSLHLTRIDTEQLVDQVMEICRTDIDEKKIAVTIDWRAANGSVRGDSARLHQVFWNLLKNAAKFTPSGGAITIRSYNDDRGRLRIEVADTGIGIEPEMLPKIFNAFEQGGRGVTQRFGGLGLGLAITRSLVELHGGSIGVVSAGRDQGSTFNVTLPTIEPVAVADGERPGGESRDTAGEPCTTYRILLVEDHTDSRTTITRLLENRGYEVLTATNIAAALQVASDTDFDLLISDIGLPDGSGMDLMRALRERGQVRGIAISGFGMEENIRQSIEAGFSEHLTKPIVFQHLLEAIRRICPEHVLKA